jgi:hypothetical protein
VNAPAQRSYLLRVAGLVPPEVLQDRLTELGLAAHQVRTVLIGRFSGQHALLELLRTLRGRGVEVLEVRRLPQHEDAVMVAGPRVSAQLTPGHASYDLTVAGDLGPGVHAALAPYAAILEELSAEMRTRTPVDVRVVDLVLLLESRGVRVASIAAVEDPPIAGARRRNRERVPEAVQLSELPHRAVARRTGTT